MMCLRCKKNETQPHPTFGYIDCEECRSKDGAISEVDRPEFYSQSKKDRIQSQRDVHEKDLIPPFIGNKPNPEFVKAYPELVEEYFEEDEILAL